MYLFFKMLIEMHRGRKLQSMQADFHLQFSFPLKLAGTDPAASSDQCLNVHCHYLMMLQCRNKSSSICKRNPPKFQLLAFEGEAV